MPPVRFYCLWCHIKKKKKLQTKLDCFKPITRHSFSLMFTLTLNLRFNRFNCYFPNERFGYEMRHQGGRARSFGSPECYRMVACYHCKKNPPKNHQKKSHERSEEAARWRHTMLRQDVGADAGDVTPYVRCPLALPHPPKKKSSELRLS